MFYYEFCSFWGGAAVRAIVHFLFYEKCGDLFEVSVVNKPSD